MSYKYKVNQVMISIQDNNTKFKIVKIADLDEFGADFHYQEKNYVVEFNINKPSATYTFIRNNQFKYIMTETDIDENFLIAE